MKKNIIETKNLTKRFGSHFVLKEVTFSVQEGAIFGIIGMSGAGKSTLIRCLNGLEKATAGSIFLLEKELTSLSKEELRETRRQLGMIFQHFNLFSSRTAIDNVVFPLEIAGISNQERYQRGEELLELVGLKEKSSFYPSQLSGGEKQRVAIARALANHPAILLCDEATSALDPGTTQSILELLQQLNERLGLTILLITHEMEVIKRICTHVAVLEKAMIVEQGATTELFASPKHPTTQLFLKNLTHDLPQDLLVRKKDADILRLSFTGKSAGEPVICKLIRLHQVDVNILLGGIDRLRAGTVGNLVIELSGPVEERAKACLFLENSGIRYIRL